jgi:S-adenosylmethionine decarboxylase proenzyme
MADTPNFPLPPGTRPLGRHVHLDLYDCPQALLLAPATAQSILRAAALKMNATIVSDHFHAFNPHGVSGVVIIAESHLSVHTWPEHGYAAVDVFSCGDLDLDAGIAVLIEGFGAGRHYLAGFDRGWVG